MVGATDTEEKNPSKSESMATPFDTDLDTGVESTSSTLFAFTLTSTPD